jgi:hypothetical protein
MNPGLCACQAIMPFLNYMPTLNPSFLPVIKHLSQIFLNCEMLVQEFYLSNKISSMLSVGTMLLSPLNILNYPSIAIHITLIIFIEYGNKWINYSRGYFSSL